MGRRLDGDGTLDVLAGSACDDSGATHAGAWFGWYGPLSCSSDTSAADVTAYGVGAEAGVGGSAPGVYDLDGDGVEDLAFSSKGAPGGGDDRGEVWLFYGPFAGSVDPTAASTDGAHFTGNADNDWLGAKTLLGPDLTGDGVPEMVTAAHGAGWGGSAAAGVYYVLDAR